MPAAKKDVAEEKNKPVFDKPAHDEQALARLLEAAYVLQEHNRELRRREVNLEIQRDQLGAEERAASIRIAESQSASIPASTEATDPPANEDYTQTLAQILEAQRQIQARNLQTQPAMDLVAERLTEIAGAGGASIGLVAGKSVRYPAVAGGMTLPGGTEVAMEKALCVASLRTGQVIRCPDVNAEFLLDVEQCQRRGIQSMIAVPIYHEGGIAGALELYFATAQAFSEQDVHTCQLMAGLVTEALVREEELVARKSISDQRAAVREALERIKPTIAAVADRVAGKTAQPVRCRKCAHELVGEEQFCGNCGTPRSGDYGGRSLQSKVASLWEMQQAMKTTTAASSGIAASEGLSPGGAKEAMPHSSSLHRETNPPGPAAVSPANDDEPPVLNPVGEGPKRVPIDIPDHVEASVFSASGDADFPPSDEEPYDRLQEETALAVTQQPAPAQPWNSAAAARDYLEQLAGANRNSGIVQFLSARRGDIYLALAVIVVAVVIRWGIWSNHPVSATGNSNAATAQHKPDPKMDLSWFDRTLISLGLADAPPAPESKGNPDAQVWVDLHTALYYCPGADLYGKTPKGKYTNQHDAQLDSFGPASGKPCD